MNEDFYHFLIRNINKCVIKKQYKDIKQLNCVIIFGSNALELTKNMIKYTKKKNCKTKIILIIQEKLLNVLKNELSEVDEVIIINGGYSNELINLIKNSNNLSEIDGVLFYTQLPNDYGNINIFNIIKSSLSQNYVHIYGVNKEYDIFEYNNWDFYLSGLKLYGLIDEFIDKASEMEL